jgi:3-deoxy-D-manno-octulosonic-acid transferase/heptosyltransferase-1
MQKPDRILIIKLSAIGDVAHSLPFLEVLKQNFPNAGIDWLVEETSAEIIREHPDLDRVIVSRRKALLKEIKRGGKWLRTTMEVVHFLKELRLRRYDLIIDLQGLLKSGILLWLSKGKRKIGLRGSREGARFFTTENPVPVKYKQHAIDRYLDVAEYLGCNLCPWDGKITVPASDKTFVENLLADIQGHKKKPLIVINPIARWKTKLWVPERFGALANRLKHDFECDVVFTGSRHDRPIIDNMLKGIEQTVINLAGQTSLKALAHLFSLSKVVITTDTGPMHIAAAMGSKVVALFGPTDPRRTGPYGPGHRVIRAPDIACGPCFKKQCADMRCMQNIPVAKVLGAVKELL